MEMQSLQDLMVENLKDLYSAETQILKAGPKMAKAVDNDQLRKALEQHLKETEKQVERLEQIFKDLGEKPTGNDKAAKLLEQTLAEEKKADQLLTQLAESTINVEAQQ
jgi:ferritin-like metal-binding protein YciE